VRITAPAGWFLASASAAFDAKLGMPA